MNKVFYFLFICIFTIFKFPATAATTDIISNSKSNDVRNVKWLYSKEEVKNNDNINDIIKEGDDHIIIQDIILGKKCLVAYGFKDNKLEGIIYKFSDFENGNEKNDCNKTLKVFKDELQKNMISKNRSNIIKENEEEFNELSSKEKDLLKYMANTLDERNPKFENERTIVEVDDECIYKKGSYFKIKYIKKDSVK